VALAVANLYRALGGEPPVASLFEVSASARLTALCAATRAALQTFDKTLGAADFDPTVSEVDGTQQALLREAAQACNALGAALQEAEAGRG
jgi:hypothetical protein